MIILFITGCEKDLDIKNLDFQRLPVVNALFDQNSDMRVYVTLNNPNPISRPLQPEEVRVILYEEGELKDTLNYEERDSLQQFGYFLPGSRTIPGKSYSVRVEVPGYQACTATTYQPDSVAPYDLVWDRDTLGGKIRFRFAVSEPAGAGNLYRVRVYVKNTLSIVDSLTGIANTVTLRDYGSLNITDHAFTRSGYYLTDAGWNGQTRIFEGEASLNYFPESQMRDLVAEVLHCSQDFYNYQSDLTRFSKATFGVYDPVFIRTNIENGLGIFAGSAPSTLSIPIP